MADQYLKTKLADASRSLVSIYQTTWHHIPEDLTLKPLNATPCHRTTNIKCQGFLKVNASAQKTPKHHLKLTSNDSKYRTENLFFPLSIGSHT